MHAVTLRNWLTYEGAFSDFIWDFWKLPFPEHLGFFL